MGMGLGLRLGLGLVWGWGWGWSGWGTRPGGGGSRLLRRGCALLRGRALLSRGALLPRARGSRCNIKRAGVVLRGVECARCQVGSGGVRWGRWDRDAGQVDRQGGSASLGAGSRGTHAAPASASVHGTYPSSCMPAPPPLIALPHPRPPRAARWARAPGPCPTHAVPAARGPRDGLRLLGAPDHTRMRKARRLSGLT